MKWPNLGRALKHRNYRLFFAGQGVSLIGTWMSRLAASWLVFRWSGDNAAWVLGLVSFIGLLPIFLLSPIAGAFVDRWGRYRVLFATQVLSLLQSAALAVVAFAAEPAAGVWMIAVLGCLQGVINAFDMPARQSLLVAMVTDREDIPNAIALNSSLVNASRLIGPTVAGLLIAVIGEAWCFVVDAISYVAVIAALMALKIPSTGSQRLATSISQQFVEGLRYAASYAPIRALLLLLGVVSFSTMAQTVLLPVFVASELKGGPHTLGLLSAASGIGAIIGALYLASRSTVLGLGRVIVLATLCLSLSMVGFAISRSANFSAGCMLGSGLAMMIVMASCNTLIQTIVEEDKRGRVMGYYSMAFQGTAPFGSLLTGWLTQMWSIRQVVLGSSIIIALAAIVFATQLPRLRRTARPAYIRLGILPETGEALP